MISRSLLLQVLAAIVLVVAGIIAFNFVTRTDTPGRHVSALDEVRTLLRDRAAMLLRGNVEGYLHPMTPAARAFEEPLARGRSQVPLVDIKVTAIPGRFQDVDAPSFRELPIDLTYRYRDLPDDNAFDFRYISTIERQGTDWIITDSHPAPKESPLDDLPVPPLWAQGPVVVDRSGHFLTLHRPGFQHEREAVALAEQARAAIQPRLLPEPDPVHLLTVAADYSQFKEMVRIPIVDEETPAAVRYRFTDISLPHNRYLAFNWPVLEGGTTVPFHGDPTSPLQVAEHELGELALFRYVTPYTPPWLNEAGGMYLAGERLDSDWRRGNALHGFDAMSVIPFEEPVARPLAATRFGTPPSLEYPFANAAVLSLVERSGPGKFFAFYKGYKYLVDLRGGLSQAKEAATDVILAIHYGIQRPELDVQTRDFIRRAVGAPS